MEPDFNDNITLVFTGGAKPYRSTPLWVRTQVFNTTLGLQEHEYFAFELPPEVTDGASIPRIVWLFLAPFDNRMLVPSQPHDHMYAKPEKVLDGVIYNKLTGKTSNQVQISYTRLDADKIIKEKMKSYGGGPILRQIVFYSVRLGGKKGYLTK